MTTFNDRFAPFFDEGDEDVADDQRHRLPAWFAPPDDELGVAVSQAGVVARSDRAVVALAGVTAFSTGVSFALVAAARGLKAHDANVLFHEQHPLDVRDDLPPGFLRVGVELADGARAANVPDRRRRAQRDEPPDAPVLVQSGGGGGMAAGGRVVMRPEYWLWPLPRPSTMRLFVEWPALDIPLSSIELDTAAVNEAAARAQPLWPPS